MRKKLLIVLSIFLVIGMLTGCTEKKKEKEINPDAGKFKEEYESLNGKKNAKGLEHRTVSIPEDNPYTYVTADEVVKMIENKESFIVYFGDTQCPWCRSVIEKATEIAKGFNTEKIYYVKIWDDDHNEVLRDVYKINDDKTVEKTQDGTEAYYKLLEYFGDVLDDYSLKDADDNPVESPEKRIYAPNFILVKKGKASIKVDGISEKQTDSRGELTEEILKDEESTFEAFFTNASTCDTEEKC